MIVFFLSKHFFVWILRIIYKMKAQNLSLAHSVVRLKCFAWVFVLLLLSSYQVMNSVWRFQYVSQVCRRIVMLLFCASWKFAETYLQCAIFIFICFSCHFRILLLHLMQICCCCQYLCENVLQFLNFTSCCYRCIEHFIASMLLLRVYFLPFFIWTYA